MLIQPNQVTVGPEGTHRYNFSSDRKSRMPDVFMSRPGSSTPVPVICQQIEALNQSMDQVEELPDGFSDSESSGDEDSYLFNHVKPATITHQDKHKHVKLCTRRVKNGIIVDRRLHLKHHRSKHDPCNKDSHDGIKYSVQDTCDKAVLDILQHYDDNVYRPISAGQCPDDVNIPIMSPPPPVEPESKYKFDLDRITSGYSYTRAITLNLLNAGEKPRCEFDNQTYNVASKIMQTFTEPTNQSECFCCAKFANDDVIGGWVAPVTRTNTLTKSGKRRRPLQKSSETAFNRLTGATERARPSAFQHHRSVHRHIEQYRFFHTVGNTGRPHTALKSVYAKRNVENDPYLKRVKTTICAMTSPSDLYQLLASQPSDNKSVVSSSGSTNDKSLDDESADETGGDPKSVKDRGKALNLAPVRECAVPDMPTQDSFDQYQHSYIDLALYQYLNLRTPPVAGKCLPYEIEDARLKRYGNRIMNTGDNNLFPAYTPRRGVRPLRLGSAEFVKPGPTNKDSKWSTEKRTMTKSPTLYTSTVPGTLIVGSTISAQSSTAHSRRSARSSSSPFVPSQRDALQQLHATNLTKPQTPPQHIAGKKYRPCERTSEISSARDRHSRLSYTHAPAAAEKVVAPIRTSTMLDLTDAQVSRRERTKPISLDVNHLGIRGHTFGQDDHVAMYKNRRVAIVKS